MVSQPAWRLTPRLVLGGRVLDVATAGFVVTAAVFLADDVFVIIDIRREAMRPATLGAREPAGFTVILQKVVAVILTHVLR